MEQILKRNLILNCTILVSIILLIGILPFQVFSATQSDIVVSQADKTGLSIVFEPRYVVNNKLEVFDFSNPQTAAALANLSDNSAPQDFPISIIGGDLVQISGQPELPVKILNIAIPPDSEPNIHVVERISASSFRAVLPVFTPTENYGPVADASAWPVLKAVAAERILGEPKIRIMNGIRVLHLPVYPLQYSKEAELVDLSSQIKLRIDFEPRQHPANYQITNQPVQLSRLAKLVLINPEQTRPWLQVTVAQFDEAGWPQGFLYSFEIEHEAIYRLTFDDLTQKGVRIPGAGLPTEQLKLFGNGGGMLPENPAHRVTIGLKECPIYVADGGDGVFGSGDWLIFYGRGGSHWQPDTILNWAYQTNVYSVKNKYWLNIDPAGGGMRMAELTVHENPDTTVTSAPTRLYSEPERFIYGRSNFVGAGRTWYGYALDGVSRYSLTLNPRNPDPSRPAILRTRTVNSLAGSGSPRIAVYLNDGLLGQFTPDLHYDVYGGVEVLEFAGSLLREGYNTLALEQSRAQSKALFDWYDLQYSSILSGALTFESIPYDGIVQYQFTDLAEPWIFDISDHNQIAFIRGSSLTNPESRFEPKRYLSTKPDWFLSVSSSFKEYFPPENDLSDLWSASNQAQLVLITPDEFWDLLEPLKEYYTRRDEPLTAVRVRLGEIYNRFSGGNLDPAAIRNFLHYAVSKPWATRPDYVVFCGDGDYNYRNIDRPPPEIFVPPFEELSWVRCTDDWFSDFDHTDNTDYLPDLINGRLTATNSWEMEAIVDKIISYDEEPEFGPWRNHVTLVADDEFGESTNTEDEHVRVQEELANIYMPSSLDKAKIYLTEYEAEIGREKTQAANDLIREINQGTLLINYLGHGNPTLWAHEHVFTQSRDLPRIERSRRLALYVAFTCDWAYWDNPQSQSFPEQLLAAANRGAIAAIASTRLTYAFSNSALAREFYRALFGPNRVTIGEALAIAKHNALIQLGPTYHLLGDPTLNLGSPRLSGTLQYPDPYPLQSLARSEIQGQTLDPNFSGKLEFMVNDTQIPRIYIVTWEDANGNIHHRPVPYLLPGSLVYRGQFSVTDGNFNGSFVVPLDVTLGSKFGLISGYFYNEDIDGVVVIDSVEFAGQAAAAIDTVAPQVDVFFDHRGYRPGDQISTDPILIVEVTDSSGLNLTGKMGHGISYRVDHGAPQDLTANFTYHLDSYTAGSLEKKIGPLTSGNHLIEIIAWDSFNNFAVEQVEVDVAQDAGGLRVDRVLNLPNPFVNTTRLTFLVNKPVDYDVYIYTVAGRKIWDYQGHTDVSGLVSEILWDGRDQNGNTVANGVYLFKVIAWDETGAKAEGLGRIAYVR